MSGFLAAGLDSFVPTPLVQEYDLEDPSWDEEEGGELEGDLEGPNDDDQQEPDQYEDEHHEEVPPSASGAIRAARARHSQNPPDRNPRGQHAHRDPPSLTGSDQARMIQIVGSLVRCAPWRSRLLPQKASLIAVHSGLASPSKIPVLGRVLACAAADLHASMQILEQLARCWEA